MFVIYTLKIALYCKNHSFYWLRQNFWAFFAKYLPLNLGRLGNNDKSSGVIVNPAFRIKWFTTKGIVLNFWLNFNGPIRGHC